MADRAPTTSTVAAEAKPPLASGLALSIAAYEGRILVSNLGAGLGHGFRLLVEMEKSLRTEWSPEDLAEGLMTELGIWLQELRWLLESLSGNLDRAKGEMG